MHCVKSQGCCSESACNTILVRLFRKNLRLRARASRTRRGRKFIGSNKPCVPCCLSKFQYDLSVAGSSSKKIPVAMLNEVGYGKEGNRARLCCCLKMQNKKLSQL